MSKPRKPASGNTSKVSKAIKRRPAVITPEILDRQFEEDGQEDTLSSPDEGETESAEDAVSEIEPSEQEMEGSMPVPAGIDANLVAPTSDKDGAIVQHDLLKRYLEEVSKYSLLSPEEEFQLAMRLKETGDLDAARSLVRANLRLVVKIAMEYRSAYQNVMDLKIGRASCRERVYVLV